MPQRMLKDSICSSEELEIVSDSAEVLFYRLMVTADDFGRFDARPPVVISRCFTLRRRMAESKIRKQLAELHQADLVRLYESEGRWYGYFPKWVRHQRVRATNSKFPAPAKGQMLTVADIRGHLPTNDSKSRTSAGSLRRRSSKSNCEVEDEVEGLKSESVSNPSRARGKPKGRVQAPESNPQTRDGKVSHISDAARQAIAEAKKMTGGEAG